MFHVTHRQHLNSDDFFAARAKSNHDGDIECLEKLKKDRLLQNEKNDKANALLNLKSEPTELNLKNFTVSEMALLASWKAGKTCKGKKTDLLEVYIGNPVPENPPCWSNDDEEELTKLKTEAITFKHTAMSTALKQSANAVKTNVSELDDRQVNELLAAVNQQQNERTTSSTAAPTISTHGEGEASGIM